MSISSNKFYISWPAIVIAMFVFWPVGLVLLFLRLREDRSAAMLGGKIVKIIGWLVTVNFTLISIGVFAAGSAAGILVLLFAVAGVFLIRYGRALENRGNLRKQYIELIVNQEHRSIDTIASIARSNDVAATLAEVQAMITDGVLPRFRLDPDTRMLTSLTPAPAALGAAPPVAFKCAGCGANNVVTPMDGIVACEYCGTART